MADLKISSLSELTAVAGSDEMVIVDKSDTTQAATGTTKKVQVQEAIQDVTHGATAKTTPADDDEVGLVDSAASYVLKKLTWTNIKATLKTYFDGLYPSKDGWISATGTWSASDANTISVASTDLTAVLQKGDKIKVTNNSAAKYYYISTTPAFSTNTTFDVAGETDLVAGAISSPYYSKADNPQGFKKGEIYYKASASKASQTLTDNTAAQIQLAETVDINGNFASYAYTAPIAGYYNVNVLAQCTKNSTMYRSILLLRKNSSGIIQCASDNYSAVSSSIETQINQQILLAKGDVIDVTILGDSSDSGNVTMDQAYFCINFVSV